MKLTSTFLVLGALVPTLGGTARADNTACSGAILVVPDGSPRDGTFTAQFQGRWFRFVAKANRSYSITGENFTSTDLQRNVIVSTPSEACGGPIFSHGFAAVGDGMEPVSASTDNQQNQTGADRITLTVTDDVELFFPMFGGPGAFRIRVDDTTMFSPYWSTKAGRQTFYSFQNTTRSGLEGTLTLLNAAGLPVSTAALTLQAGATVFTNTTAMGVAADQRGGAVFIHLGPAGAVLAQARVDEMPVRFEAVRDQR